MDVYLCHRFLCLSNPESWSAFAVAAAANSTQPVPTAADLKPPRLPEWLSGQVRTYTVLDGGCHMLEVFRMIKESESWIFLAESFISQNKTKTKLNNDSLCRYLFAEVFTTCFFSKFVHIWKRKITVTTGILSNSNILIQRTASEREACSIFFILKKLCSC